MLSFVSFFSFLCFFLSPFPCGAAINAADIDKDALKRGLEAYDKGDWETAEKLFLPYQGKLAEPDRLLKIIAIKKRNSPEKLMEKDVEAMRRGDTDTLEKYGAVYRQKGNAPVGVTVSLALTDMAKRAKSGDENAAYTMGLYFQDGFIVKQSMADAAAYFSIAAEKKHPPSVNNLGLYYRFGIGVDKDEERARSLFRSAAEARDPHAAFNLAQMYYDGVDKKGKDMLKAFLFADFAALLSDGKALQPLRSRALSLKKKAFGKQTPLQKGYLKKFLPYDIAPLFSTEYVAGRKTSNLVPALPADGAFIRETDFMRQKKSDSPFKYALAKDPEKTKDKDLIPLLPPFLEYQKNGAVNELFKNPPFDIPDPFAEDGDVLKAAYYRPALPRTFRLTLNKEASGIPLMAGDTLTLRFYTRLRENDTTKKGGAFTLKNTDYDLTVDNKSVLAPSTVRITPVKDETANTEGWGLIDVKAVSPGKAAVSLIPKTPDAFGYRFIVLVVPEPSDAL